MKLTFIHILLIILSVKNCWAQNTYNYKSPVYDSSWKTSPLPIFVGLSACVAATGIGYGLGNKIEHNKYSLQKYSKYGVVAANTSYIFSSSIVTWWIAKQHNSKGTYKSTLIGSIIGASVGTTFFLLAKNASNKDPANCNYSDNSSCMSDKRGLILSGIIFGISAPIISNIISDYQNSRKQSISLFQYDSNKLHFSLSPAIITFVINDNKFNPGINVFKYEM